MCFYPANNGSAATKRFSSAETQDFAYRKGNYMFPGIFVSCDMTQPVLIDWRITTRQGAVPLTAEPYLESNSMCEEQKCFPFIGLPVRPIRVSDCRCSGIPPRPDSQGFATSLATRRAVQMEIFFQNRKAGYISWPKSHGLLHLLDLGGWTLSKQHYRSIPTSDRTG